MCDLCYTPDLSQSYTPNPKPLKKVKIPSNKLKPGEKTKEWEDIRGEVKVRFAKAKITKCELKRKGCWKDNALTFAHTDKRRKLTKEDLYNVVLACTPCHMEVEALPAQEMKKILEGVIKKRSVKI